MLNLHIQTCENSTAYINPWLGLCVHMDALYCALRHTFHYTPTYS